MRQTVFLFGAGASFGAGGILPEQPPLGFQLYRELVKSYPGSWGQLPAHIRDQFDRDFEAGMRLVHDEAGGAIPQLMREMAVYFIQFRPVSPQSLYRQLARRLATAGVLSDVLFSTLNYECVLDFALSQEGVRISYFDDQDHEAVPLWKLHGSCNMFAEGLSAGPGVAYGTGVVWEGGIRALASADEVIQHCLVETGLAPVMSLYMEGKPLNVSPRSIKHLQEQWTAMVSHAAKIICVGVRPLQADTHIWTPLYDSPATLYFVGDHQAFTAWSNGRRAQSHWVAPRFNEGFTSICETIAQ